jgi:hypothetical protein
MDIIIVISFPESHYDDFTVYVKLLTYLFKIQILIGSRYIRTPLIPGVDTFGEPIKNQDRHM